MSGCSNMRINFIGTGSAFAVQHFQSNAVLEIDGKKMLIDCGGTVHMALAAAGIKLAEIDAVYITHLHADHWGGGEFLAYSGYFSSGFLVNGVRRQLKLFAHDWVRDGLFSSLKMGTVLADRRPTLDTFFDVKRFEGEEFEWQGVKFQLIRVVHVLDDGVPLRVYGLSWQTPSGRKVWYSADAVLTGPPIPDDGSPITPDEKLFEEADVIFHDCETASPSGVHAHYSELKRLRDEVRRKIWLYHYNDGVRADAVADGFCGWVKQGAWFDLR
jgi:ribonuclease BN (tRNA processing enzyme)